MLGIYSATELYPQPKPSLNLPIHFSIVVQLKLKTKIYCFLYSIKSFHFYYTVVSNGIQLMNEFFMGISDDKSSQAMVMS